jgi:hypothetical protein
MSRVNIHAAAGDNLGELQSIAMPRRNRWTDPRRWRKWRYIVRVWLFKSGMRTGFWIGRTISWLRQVVNQPRWR